MNKQHYVRLTAAERGELSHLIRREARVHLRPNSCPHPAPGRCRGDRPAPDRRGVAAAVGVERAHRGPGARRVCRRGVAATLRRRPRAITAAQARRGGEARLIALACDRPAARPRPLDAALAAERLVELEVVEASPPKPCAPRSKKRPQAVAEAALVHPAEADAAFVAAMEDVLDVYARPLDPAPAAGLLRRGGQGTAGPGAPPAARRPGPPRPRRQRVRAPRQRQPLPGVRPPPAAGAGSP